MLGQMLELAMILRRRRFSRGALELTLPEVEIELGADGQVTGAHLAAHDESHQVIEEFMLAANEAVAATLTEHEIGFLRRAHPDPEPFKLDEFAEFARSLGLAIDQPQSRFELQRVLDETIGTPEEYAVHYGLLAQPEAGRLHPRARGALRPGQRGLLPLHLADPPLSRPAGPSPVDRLARGQEAHGATTTSWSPWASTAPGPNARAEAAERELIRVKLLTYLEERLGQSFHAIIVGVEDFGLFCRLAELPVEGLIHVTSLRDDYYYLEAGTHTLVGRRSGRRHRLGDRELVRIAHVDVDRRELDLVLADSTDSRARRAGPQTTIVNPRRADSPQNRAERKSRRERSLQDERTAGQKQSKRPEKRPRRTGRRRPENPARRRQALSHASPRCARLRQWRRGVRQANRFRGRKLEQERFVPSESSSTTKNHLVQHPQVAEQLHRFSKIRLVKIQRNLAIGTAQHIVTIVRRGATRNQLEGQRIRGRGSEMGRLQHYLPAFSSASRLNSMSVLHIT